MIIPIKGISLSKLLKLHHSQLVIDIVAAIEWHKVHELHLQTGYEMLLQMKEHVNLLCVPYGKHPLTKEITALRIRRVELAGVICTQMQVLERANVESEREIVKIASYEVRLSLLGIRKNNQEIISGMLNRFFYHIDKDPEVMNAFIALGLGHYITELREINNSYAALWLKRNKSISLRPKVDSKALQRCCQSVVRHFLEQVDLAQKLYKHIDYEPFIYDLNLILTNYEGYIKKRATYSKKRTAIKKALAARKEKMLILSVNGKETGSVAIVKKNERK